MEAEIQLLAKTITELEISTDLYQAAQDEEIGISWESQTGPQRSTASSSVDHYLSIILGESSQEPSVTRAADTLPQNIAEARETLTFTIEDALDLILERASTTGQAALSGVLGLGVAELAQAAGMVGMNIAEALGQAEKVSRLYDLFRAFVTRAYETLLTLFGEQVGHRLTQEAARQALEWVDDLKEGKLLSEVLEHLYQTKQTKAHLQPIVEQSPASLEHLVPTIQGIDHLNRNYAHQVELTERILKVLNWSGGISTAILPQGTLVLATIYITLGSYVVLVGADCVDAPSLQLLDRIPGVRRLVETHIQAS
jgi:hypothetical protein